MTRRKSTQDLIDEYEKRIAKRWTNCQIGSSRSMARQDKIDALVNEISARADAGDPVALAWYEEEVNS